MASVRIFAGTVMRPSSTTFSKAMTVLNVVSESDPVITRLFPSNTKRKLSKIGSVLFAAIAFETINKSCVRSVLDTVNFISFSINFSIFPTHKINNYLQ